MFYKYICDHTPIATTILGYLLCIGGVISYAPQYFNLITTKQHKGISELSLLLLNAGSASLAANALILNWYKFECYYHCNFWLCTNDLLSMYQIILGWLVVFPLYLLFVRYKIKNSERKAINDIIYVGIYIIFILVMIIVGLVEKLSQDNTKFFIVCAKILGVLSAVFSSIVWIPQIIKLLKTQQQGNLSLLMFIMQTPGNAIIILFQLLYNQDWTTWISYVITLIEQTMIVIILIIYSIRDRNNPETIN